MKLFDTKFFGEIKGVFACAGKRDFLFFFFLLQLGEEEMKDFLLPVKCQGEERSWRLKC